MTDWLLNLPEGHCRAGHWDNSPKSTASRVFLPLFFLLCAGVVVALGHSVRDGARREDGYSFGMPTPRSLSLESVASSYHQVSEIIRRPPKERMWHLDFARIVCVSCVVIEHSGGATYSRHNVGFVLQWVLPYLFLTSGICFSLSSTPLWFYIARLAAVLAFGVGVNWIADALRGRNWVGDFGNTVFQMFYVVALIILALVTASLRRGLKWRRENPAGPLNWKISSVVLMHGLLCFVGFCFFVRGWPLVTMPPRSGWLGRVQPVTENSALILAGTGGVLFLCGLACLVRTSTLLGWILLAVIYVPRVFIPFDGVGYAHNVELYLFGMVVESWPLRGNKVIADWVRSYWTLMLGVLLFLGMPNLTGRCDLNPPDSWWERFRFYLIECVLVISFVSGALNSSDPLKITRWLNPWALYAYCTHVAWYRALPVPWGAMVTYSCLPLFYLRQRLWCRHVAAGRPGPQGAAPACRAGSASPTAGACAEVLPANSGQGPHGRGGDRSRPGEDDEEQVWRAADGAVAPARGGMSPDRLAANGSTQSGQLQLHAQACGCTNTSA